MGWQRPISKEDIVFRHNASIQRGFALLWQKCQYNRIYYNHGIVPASKEDLFWQKYQNPKRIYCEYGISAIIQGGFNAVKVPVSKEDIIGIA